MQEPPILTEPQEVPAWFPDVPAAWSNADPAPLLLLDSTYRCLYANQAAAPLLARLQWNAAGGNQFLLLFAPGEHDVIAASCDAVLAGDTRDWSSFYRDAAGRDLAVEYLLRRVQREDAAGNQILVHLRDVSEVRRQARAAAALAAIAHAADPAGPTDQVLRQLAHHVVLGGDFVACLVWLIQGEAGGPHIGGTYGVPDGYTEALRGLTSRGIVLPGYQAFLSRRTLVRSGLRTQLLADPTYASLHSFWRDFMGESVICLPLLYGDRAVGSLVVWHTGLDDPDDETCAFLQDAARHVALVVENARLALELRAASSTLWHDSTVLQLQEKETQYRAIFEAASDGLIIADMTGLIIEANPAACTLHGYSYQEFVMLPSATLVHPDSMRVLADCQHALSAGHDFHGRMTSLRKDGSTFTVDLHAVPLTYRGKLATLRILRDVSEAVRAYQLLEQGVEERTRELTTLLEVSHDLASTLELQPLLQLILNQLRALVDYSNANVMTLEGQWLTLIGVYGAEPLHELVGRRISLEQAAANRAVVSGRQPVIIEDTLDDTPLARSFREVGAADLDQSHLHVGSWLGVPLVHKEQVIGMLGLSHNDPHFYTPHHARLVLGIANQAAVAIENARLYAHAQELAAFNERQRLARDLHDSVSQALYGIALGAHTARAMIDRDPTQLAKPLDYVVTLAEAGLTEMRALIFELRPESLATEGLIAAIGHQTAMVRARYGLAVEAELCDEPDLPFGVKEALYRVVQEAMHNIVKHAHASFVQLHLQHTVHGTMLTIADDGAGFDPRGVFPGHLGLRSMRERIDGLRGTLDIRSGAGQGTRLYVWVPA